MLTRQQEQGHGLQEPLLYDPFVPIATPMVDEGLTASQTLLSFLPFRHPKSFFAMMSGGIGWAMGGAIGVAFVMPGRPVVATVGDGRSMYSIQALWTAANLKLPLTYVIANNRTYRILKERLVSFRRTEKFIGMDFHDPPLDFVGVARSMRASAASKHRTTSCPRCRRPLQAARRTSSMLQSPTGSAASARPRPRSGLLPESFG